MNFKENYQKEMNKIQKPSDITEKILNAVDTEQEDYAGRKNRKMIKNTAVWKTAAAAIAIVCVLGILQHEKVTSFAESIVEGFTLSVNHEKDIGFDKIKPVNMDLEAFINDAETEPVENDPNNSCSQLFTSYQDMNQLTHLELPGADKVTYKEIMLHVDPEYHVGHLSVTLMYQGMHYRLNGMFALEGFDQKNWGYGDKGKKEIYEYGGGKKACLVTSSKTKDEYERVYFEEKNILFQGFFDNEGAGPSKKQMKELLDLFGSEN